MWFCEACEKDQNFSTKFSNNKSSTDIENGVISRINNKLTVKRYAYVNPKLDQVDGLVKRAADGCPKYFGRFENKSVIVLKLSDETSGTTNFLTLSNKYRNQQEQIIEVKELGNQIDEFLEGEIGDRFDSSTKLTKKNV